MLSLDHNVSLLCYFIQYYQPQSAGPVRYLLTSRLWTGQRPSAKDKRTKLQTGAEAKGRKVCLHAPVLYINALPTRKKTQSFGNDFELLNINLQMSNLGTSVIKVNQ